MTVTEIQTSSEPQIVHPDSSIASLSLTGFRNYPHAELHFSGSPVLLIGPNGAGKTNILEALSLLAPGRGLRRASLGEMACTHQETGWSVSALLMRDGMPMGIGTALEVSERGTERRILRIDGENERSQARLLEYLHVLWLTPAMCHMFSEGNMVRRRFLDRLVYGFDQEHASRIAAYEHHTRERSRLLAQPSPDTTWLDTLERKMAEYSVAIAAARHQALEHLGMMLAETRGSFPAARLVMDGVAESALEAGEGALVIEDELVARLAAHRETDARTGRASAGAHKTRLEVWLMEKSCEAAQCSTGEQKALLLSVILAQARAVKRWRGFPPILLLDEVVAHLDSSRRVELFAELRDLGVQAFLTGTDAADFSAAGEGAQMVRVEEGEVL